MNPTSSYFDQYVLAADPLQLIRLLYQKAISLVQDARRCLSAGEIAKRSAAITKAYEIVAELNASLKEEVAPDLCKRLRSLYLYIQQRLLDANMLQTEAPLNEVIQLLTTLGEAWVVPEPTKAPSEGPAIGGGYAAPLNDLRRTAAQAYAA